MKTRFMAILMMLFALLCPSAGAEMQSPLNEEGEPAVIRQMLPWAQGMAAYSSVEERLYLFGAEDALQSCILTYDNSAVQADITALEKRMDAAGVNTSGLRRPDPVFLTDGETLMAVSQDSGALMQLDVRGSEAHLTAQALMDILPEKPVKGFCYCLEGFLDQGHIYLLVQSQSAADDSVDTALYAYDRQTLIRREIPLDLPEGYYASEIVAYREGQALVNALRKSDYGAVQALAVDLLTGETRTLREITGLLTLPQQAAVMAYDAQRDVIILRWDDLLYAIVPGRGLLAIGRLEKYIMGAVVHPDGRVLVHGRGIQTYDANRALELQPLSVLTDGIFTPDSAYNTEIPDIQIITTEARELMGDQRAADHFASDMTTQSARWDIYVLPISQARQIAEKGYYVPITGVQAEAFLADLHPFVREQVIDAEGRLMMAPIDVYRRDTIAYDPRAAALLGISEEDLPSTYAEMFDFILHFEENYGDLAFTHDISLFSVSSARAVGKLRERVFQDAIALSWRDPKALSTHAEEMGALLDASLPLGRSISDVVTPYFSVPTIMSASSEEPPAHLEEPAFLFTLDMSSLPSSQREIMPYKYLMYMKAFDLALSADTPAIGIYSGYAMVINPYSTRQEAIARYIAFALRHLSDRAQADLLLSAQPVESIYMMTYTQDAASIAAREVRMDASTPEERERLQELNVFLRSRQKAMQPFLYEITPEQIARYHAALPETLAVWMEVAEAVEPCQSAWEQFLRGGLSGAQVVRRVMEVGGMRGRE